MKIIEETGGYKIQGSMESFNHRSIPPLKRKLEILN